MPVTTGTTVNGTPLLVLPPAATVTFPVVAPVGTGAVMLVLLEDVGVALVPLNANVSDEPKFVPKTVTLAPTGPTFSDKPEMLGIPLPAGLKNKPLMTALGPET